MMFANEHRLAMQERGEASTMASVTREVPRVRGRARARVRARVRARGVRSASNLGAARYLGPPLGRHPDQPGAHPPIRMAYHGLADPWPVRPWP